MKLVTYCECGDLFGAMGFYNSGKDLKYQYHFAMKAACINGHLDIAKWLHKIGANVSTKLLLKCCKNGQIELVKWLHSIGVDITEDSLLNCCLYGHQDLVKWIQKINPIMISESVFVLTNSCYSGNIELVKWVYSFKNTRRYCNELKNACHSGNIELVKWVYEICPKEEIILAEAFELCCLVGNFEIGKWIYSKGYFKKNSNMFYYCCASKNLEMVMWLHSEWTNTDEPIDLSDSIISAARLQNNVKLVDWLVDICSDTIIDNDAFYWSCRRGYINLIKHFDSTEINGHSGLVLSCKYGHLDLAKWFVDKYNESKINLHKKAFDASCSQGHTDIAKWLISIGLDYKDRLQKAFIRACAKGHLETAQWVATLGIDVNTCQCAFIRCCDGGHSEIAEWLNSVGNFRQSYDSALIDACCLSQMKIIKWLHGLGATITKSCFDVAVSNDNCFVMRWIYKKTPTLLSNYINYMNCESDKLLRIVGISEQSIELFQCIFENKSFPEIEVVEDCVLRALAYHNCVDQLIKLREQFQYITFSIIDEQVVNLSTRKIRVKNARPTENLFN